MVFGSTMNCDDLIEPVEGNNPFPNDNTFALIKLHFIEAYKIQRLVFFLKGHITQAKEYNNKRNLWVSYCLSYMSFLTRYRPSQRI